MSLTDAELGYIAGIIDGEGTIALHAHAARTEYCFPFVQIANTDERLIDWIEARIAIPHGRYRYDRKPGIRKPAYLLMWRGSRAIEFLKLVRSYLVIKAEQADIVQDTWDGEAGWNQEKRGRWCSHNPMTDEVRERRIAAFHRCRELNRKGPAPTPEPVAVAI